MTKHPEDKVALISLTEQGEGAEITYGELNKQANRLAHGLTNLGLSKGDRVLVMVPRSIAAYVIYIASLKAGLAIIPSSEMLRAKDLSYRLRHSEAKAVIAWPNGITEVESIEETLPDLSYRITAASEAADRLPEGWTALDSLMHGQPDDYAAVGTHRDDIAILAYTSGTTGNPKGVVHSHGWGYAHLRIVSSLWLDIQPGDTVWATAAPGWQKWIWTPFLSVLGNGATGLVYNGPFQSERYLQLLQDEGIQVLCCTPTEYRIMAKSETLSHYDLTGLRCAVSAGEPLNQEVINRFKQVLGITIRDGYGQTENTLIIGNFKNAELKAGSMGKAINDGMVAVVDEDGRPLPAGIVGDIAVHLDMPALFKQYYKAPERKSAQSHGSYFITGDRARKDEDGYFWFEGRGDDIIISSGYTIGPFEVEDALMKHPAVKECAVVASPDEIRGHVVKALIVLKDAEAGSQELVKELQDHVKQWTAPYKYPRKIEFVADLPKTSSGKIHRIDLREQENQTRQK
ncbi:acyl-CoA synthetase [Paenibacillus sp. NPDC058071]|uniref:acyl-CoA synthetase n=1 Tax=Paenibacillus sp. NPDC058071 TaxID=3346326 RepID=UPI0036DABC7B